MCLHLSLAAVFIQNKAIQMSLNQNISFCSLCDHIQSDPLSWECQQWNPRQEFWPVHCQGKLDSLGSGINVTFCWFKISLDPLSTRQKCCFFCACWAIVWKLMEELLNAWHFALAAQLFPVCPTGHSVGQSVSCPVTSYSWGSQEQFHVENSVSCYLEIPRERESLSF